MTICAKCLVTFQCEKNGVLVAYDKHGVRHADLYKCPKCDAEILTGFGQYLVYDLAEKYYAREIGKYRILYRIDTNEVLQAEIDTTE